MLPALYIVLSVFGVLETLIPFYVVSAVPFGSDHILF